MLALKSKKIYIYIFLLLFCTTLNNKYFYNLDFPKINNIEVSGLEQKENIKLINQLDSLKMKNLFFLKKDEIEKIFDSNYLIEKYHIFKNYPSSLKLKIIKTKFLATTNRNGKLYIIGSNGKYIEGKKVINDIPFIFGDVDIKEFLKFKMIIDNSDLNFNEIKKLFYFQSGRWDLETNSGILIRYPKKNLRQSLNLSIKILDDENFKDAKIIDLRQNKQVVVNEK